MRIKPGVALILIILLTLGAVWIDLPDGVLDPFNWKGDRITVHEGLDLQGGLQVILQAQPPAGQSVSRDALLGTRDTIERRVNALGVSEPLIQTRGDDQIVVELPGVKDPEAAVNILKETALLEIINPNGQYLPEGTLVNTTLGPADSVGTGSPAATPGATPSATPEATPGADGAAGTEAQATPEPSGPVYETIVTGADLKDAYPTTDPQTGALVVGFELKPEAAQKFYDFTSTHIGQPMSIVVDKRVISTAEIRNPIRDQGVIQGMPATEVNALALQLKSGALAVPLEVVQSRTVGPTLGQDSIDKSIVAGIVGLGLVALFMILFYRVPGVLSVVALMVYSAIVFALFKSIPVVLTLAGIAGFILSIGMAVDANVLIFSRMKEELRRGIPVRRAIEAGFDHAWPSIRDSNISTMITCVILYWFGRYTGASIIQGFALTLFIGVAVSMFSAITVTRTLLRVMLTRGFFHNEWWFGVESAPIPPAGRTASR
ncbi:protein translocase subunit SecD [Sphaerobacter sp.]|uniref:protein translocase subunit SecD n=1 Tax=Sphaerobacter sp. TaxID=2099654 RepID=UPI001D5CEC60|nr:protein translocase subunit SecD [Sphaerobacter sp.]MBX5445653.1 protein translocase subunit SecD [Sphaerobacter sp.]